MVRPSYRANFTSGTGDTANPFAGLVFDAATKAFDAPVRYDRDGLPGGYPAPRRYIGWQGFFDFGDGKFAHNKKIDTAISSVLFTVPVPAIASHTQTSPAVLPQRNLLRQLTWGLPSGQAVARAWGWHRWPPPTWARSGRSTLRRSRRTRDLSLTSGAPRGFDGLSWLCSRTWPTKVTSSPD
jgi:hypothetical protein